MKHVDRVLEAHRVDSTVCVTRVGRYDFEDGPTAEPLQSFYARVFFTPLSGIKGLSDIPSHRCWEAPEIPPGGPYPPDRLQLAFHLYHYTFMCIFCQEVPTYLSNLSHPFGCYMKRLKQLPFPPVSQSECKKSKLNRYRYLRRNPNIASPRALPLSPHTYPPLLYPRRITGGSSALCGSAVKIPF